MKWFSFPPRLLDSFDDEIFERLPAFCERAKYFAREHSGLMAQINNPIEEGIGGRHLLAPYNPGKLRRILARMLDESEFPAESSTGLFGGNSNWRGPIWMPVNVLLVQSLRKLYSYYGNDFKIECPTGSTHDAIGGGE